MTRSQLFRHLVALLLLPNVTAWRYALPLGAKRPMNRRYCLHLAMIRDDFAREYCDFRRKLAAGTLAISSEAFRIPIQIVP